MKNTRFHTKPSARLMLVSGLMLALEASFAFSSPAKAADTSLNVRIEGVTSENTFPDSAAFCTASPAFEGATARNINPALSWTPGPTGTKSYVLLMTDPDVPADFSQINRDGITITADSPRISVFHWVLTDIPSTRTHLARGEESDRFVAGGKPVGATEHGVRGANIYTDFFKEAPGMKGIYGGYDGPCPPINDARPHTYRIRIIALDVPTLSLHGPFTGKDVEKAIEGHILAEGHASASYALNPALRRP